MSEKEQILLLEKVLNVVQVAFNVSNSAQDGTITKSLVDELGELITYCQSENANLLECHKKMKELAASCEDLVLFKNAVVSFDDAGLISSSEDSATIIEGENIINKDVMNRIASIYGDYVMKQKSECDGDGIFDAQKEVEFSDHKKTHYNNPYFEDDNPVECPVPITPKAPPCPEVNDFLSIDSIRKQIKLHQDYLSSSKSDYVKLTESERQSEFGEDLVYGIECVTESLEYLNSVLKIREESIVLHSKNKK